MTSKLKHQPKEIKVTTNLINTEQKNKISSIIGMFLAYEIKKDRNIGQKLVLGIVKS